MCTRTHRYINVILHYVMNTKFLTLSRNSIKPERQDVTEFQQRHSTSSTQHFSESDLLLQWIASHWSCSIFIVWKIARLTSRHRCSKKAHQPIRGDNYRPISVLPCLSKIITSFVNTDLRNFAHEAGLIGQHQFAYSKFFQQRWQW